jgi:hypothetical protein
MIALCRHKPAGFGERDLYLVGTPMSGVVGDALVAPRVVQRRQPYLRSPASKPSVQAQKPSPWLFPSVDGPHPSPRNAFGTSWTTFVPQFFPGALVVMLLAFLHAPAANTYFTEEPGSCQLWEILTSMVCRMS